MTKDMRDKWVQALRSGEYTQGRHWLKFDGRFCCLGVRCDLDGVEWQPHDTVEKGSFFAEPDKPGDLATRWTGFIPSQRREAWGIRSDHLKHLVRMNDDGNSFAEIADWIEANVPVDA